MRAKRAALREIPRMPSPHSFSALRGTGRSEQQEAHSVTYGEGSPYKVGDRSLCGFILHYSKKNNSSRWMVFWLFYLVTTVKLPNKIICENRMRSFMGTVLVLAVLFAH